MRISIHPWRSPLNWPICLLLLAGIVMPGSLSAQDGSAPLPEFDPTGFTRIFDGETLDGWDGDPTYWSVNDGVLVGTVTPDTLLKKNSWIVWRGGLVEDFELVLDYRVSAEGNSGVGYRLAVLENDSFSVRGPQADIHGADMFTGICYEENGRRLLAARGQSTWIDPESLPRLIAQTADPEELQSVIHKEDWNRYRLVVEGEHARHFINGELMSEVFDHDAANRMQSGLIGVQVHVGPPMTIEFRDIYLKHIGTTPDGSAERDSVVYRPGSLLEWEHPPTFDNLSTQTAETTAPRVSEPIGGETELVVDSGQLAFVRRDLEDVELYGESRPLSEVREFDLVIVTDERTIRVSYPSQMISNLGSSNYRVELKWNADESAYEIVSLSEISEATE